MIKKFSILILLSLSIFLFASCNKKVESEEKDINENKITITSTIFPLYDVTKTIIGDNSEKFNLNILLKSGLDLHNFQPSVMDIDTISNSHMFIYIGGESDERWVDRVIDTANNTNLISINLMEELSDIVKTEELKEGMMDEEEHEEDIDEIEKEHEDEEFDEHIWLSLPNIKRVSKVILDKICSLDSNNTMKYIENYNNFIDSINELNKEYIDTVNNSINKVLLFGDRFPFRYLVDDYGLDYYAAFKGCSAETEASFETIAFLTEKLNELNLDNVIVLEGSDKKIAETIISNSNNKNRKILSLNSMQSVNSNDIKNGVTYIKIMKENLKVIKEALK